MRVRQVARGTLWFALGGGEAVTKCANVNTRTRNPSFLKGRSRFLKCRSGILKRRRESRGVAKWKTKELSKCFT